MSPLHEPAGYRRQPGPQEGLADLSEKILSAATHEAVAAHTRWSASALTHSRWGIVRDVNRATGRILAPGPDDQAGIRALVGRDPALQEEIELLLARVAAQRAPLVTVGIDEGGPRAGAAGTLPHLPRLLAVPALRGEQVVAVIAVADAPRDYTPEDVTVVKRHAALYGLALKRLDLESELRESEVRYRDIIETSHDLIQSVRPDGTFDFVNQAWRTSLGYTAAEVQRLTVFDVIAPDLIPHCRELFGRIMQGESIPDHETAFVAKGGARVLLQGSMIPRLSGGRVVATHAFFRDVTELRRTEKFVKDVLDSVDEAFVVLDPAFRVLNANSVYSRIAAQPLEQLIGRHCATLAAGPSPLCPGPGGDCPAGQVFRSGEPHATSCSCTAADGSTRFLEIKAFPVRDHSGAVVSAIEIVSDVTEKRQLEEQLRTAQKMEAVGLLADGVAHDFNNLLQAILGYGSILRSRVDAATPLARHVEQILLAGNQAAELTRGLLAFSRKRVVNPAPADLNEILSGACAVLQRQIGGQIELRVLFDELPLPVLVDRDQIVQVLMNLATNARDAMPRGGVLTIRTGRSDTGGRDAAKAPEHAGAHATLTVADSGEGLDRATTERLFEPFFTTKELGRGTGLGLSIVYGIVKRHHGEISVSSDPAAGTTFRILLPLHAAKALPPAAAQPAAAGGTETVLLAEDEPAVRALLATVLGEAGYTVIEAADGEEAVAAFCRQPAAIKLALLDVIMPRRNGREVSEEIRRISPGVRIVFMSGYTDDVIAQRGLLAEGVRLIAKPVDPAVFLAGVRAALDAP
jgi:PAS domain S-box-containing protein